MWDELPIEQQAVYKARQGVNSPVLEGLMVADPVTLEPVPSDGETIGETFAPLRWKLMGHTYLARSLQSPTLDTINPFKLLADHSGGTIGDYTLVITGTTLGDGSPGFILLASNEGRASGEELQDHACLGH